MNKASIFNTIRRLPGFQGKLTSSQVEGTERIIDYALAKSIIPEYTAYMLATTAWETAYTMQPIVEHGSDEYKRKLYDITGQRPELAKKYGNIHPGDGIKFCGRGLVQLTWHDNYLAAGKALGIDLVGNPDLACSPDVAVQVMVYGMTTGLFTGKKLSDYKGTNGFDWVNARRIINGTDRATEIAGIGKAIFVAWG